MHIAKTLTLIGITLLTAGCVPSLHPLYTEKDLVLKPELMGTWVGENAKDTWVLQKPMGKAYEGVYTENGEPERFETRFLKLGEFLFVDFFPEEPNMRNGFYSGHLIRVHSFARIRVEGDNFEMAMLDPDWLKKMIDEDKVKIAHEQLDEGMVLTASTLDLQKFVLKYAGDENAFSNRSKWVRHK